MQADTIIIGGGIAGLSAAFFLSESLSVVLLEREEALGYHSSGRTAAQFTVGIGVPTMRRLAWASRPFLEAPPCGFAPEPLLSPRGCLTVARRDQEARLEQIRERLADVGARAETVDRRRALALFPALVADKVDGGVFEPDAMDIDVDQLLQGYRRGAMARDARILTGVDIVAIDRRGGAWVVETRDAAISAPMVVNAAGAWADAVARLAGRSPVGVTPHRRTAFTFVAPAGVDTASWPHVSNVDYRWYVKPEAGRIMGSLSDAVPTAPADVHPEDIDVARAIYNIEQDTTLRIARPLAQWAGLRTFVADREPVAGMRPGDDGFFWLAGQGGCGVLTSPALGQAIAALVQGRALPAAQRALGIMEAHLSPAREALAAPAAPSPAPPPEETAPETGTGG